MKRIIIIALFIGLICPAMAQVANINNFLVKENLLKNNKLAIIAADSLNNPIETINGTYTFSVSGFTQVLNFTGGIAVLPLPIERSTFVYIKHENETGTHSKLVYVYKKENNLTPYAVNSWWMILFPVIVIILAIAFRKFIIIAVILLLVFMYFNHSNGLNLSTFFETIFDRLKGLF